MSILTFNVHRDGRITDLTVLKPSAVEGFTNAAVNAHARVEPYAAAAAGISGRPCSLHCHVLYNEPMP